MDNQPLQPNSPTSPSPTSQEEISSTPQPSLSSQAGSGMRTIEPLSPESSLPQLPTTPPQETSQSSSYSTSEPISSPPPITTSEDTSEPHTSPIDPSSIYPTPVAPGSASSHAEDGAVSIAPTHSEEPLQKVIRILIRILGAWFTLSSAWALFGVVVLLVFLERRASPNALSLMTILPLLTFTIDFILGIGIFFRKEIARKGYLIYVVLITILSIGLFIYLSHPFNTHQIAQSNFSAPPITLTSLLSSLIPFIFLLLPRVKREFH